MERVWDVDRCSEGRVLFSVIVPAYNAGDTIGRCIEALLKQSSQDGRYEIIVVDDGSTDNTPEVVQSFSGVRFFQQDRQGPASARNLGARKARGDFILFTDADCEPVPEWAERLLAPLREGNNIVGAKGAYLTRQRELISRFVQLEYEEKYERMAKERFIDFVDTYSAAYRREIFLQEGGFDPSFPTPSVEDQELSFRLAEKGYKMVFVPEAKVYHQHPSSLIDYLLRKFRIGYWKVLVHWRHPGKIFRDSHTPQTLKLQIIFAFMSISLILISPVLPHMLWGGAVSGVCFFLSTVPFSSKAFRKDSVVGLVSPLLLLLRALFLGAGLIAGILTGAFLRGTSRSTVVS